MPGRMTVRRGILWNQFSHYFKGDISSLTSRYFHSEEREGYEIFYDFALTPALRIIPESHIWNPLTAKVAAASRIC